MPIDDMRPGRRDEPEYPQTPQWFVAWTQSHCERLVHDQLVGAGFDAFLPTLNTWSRQRGVQKTIAVPMFAGYVFVRRAMDKRSYVDIVKTRGLVRLLGESWDRLSPVPDDEIQTIRTIANADAPVFPYPYLREGQQVRIVEGPLTGVEGVLVQTKPRKGLLVVSIDLLQRSVAVELEVTDVVPVSAVCHANVRDWTNAALAAHPVAV